MIDSVPRPRLFVPAVLRMRPRAPCAAASDPLVTTTREHQVAVNTFNLTYPKHVSEEIDLLSRALGRAYRVYIFADYGGTLVPSEDGNDADPNARPPEDLLRRLEQLAQVSCFSIYVLSGRPMTELDELVGVEGVGLIGQGGFEIRKPGGEIVRPVDVGEVGPLLQHIELAAHGCLCSHEGVEIVNNGFAIVLKYGTCECKTARRATQCFTDLVRSLDTRNRLEVLYNKGAVEARMAGWRKGDAVAHILREADTEETLAIYIGDDVTDEEAFEVICEWSGDEDSDEPWMIGDPDDDDESIPRALAILVSATPRPTTASLFVRGPHEVYEFLSSMTAIATALM